MPSLKLKIQYNKNEGLVMSPTELRENYLFGIPFSGNDGRKISNQAVKEHIINAQKKIENLFSIKFNKQVIEESRDFVRQEFNTWGYIRTMYPIVFINELKGMINDVQQISYPKQWLSIKKISEIAIYRNVYLVPNNGNGTSMDSHSISYNGLSPNIRWMGQSFIPNYWKLKYITGWNEIPKDLLDFVAKYAAINVLGLLGDILYGVGITSIQLSLDGVSQSTPLSRSAQGGIFAGRIKQYTEEIKTEMPNLRNQYRGITFEVL